MATFVSAARAIAVRIDEVGGAFLWRWRIVVVGNAVRYVPIGQILESVWRKPTLMRNSKL
jgi:urease accessory protein UreF